MSNWLPSLTLGLGRLDWGVMGGEITAFGEFDQERLYRMALGQEGRESWECSIVARTERSRTGAVGASCLGRASSGAGIQKNRIGAPEERRSDGSRAQPSAGGSAGAAARLGTRLLARR